MAAKRDRDPATNLGRTMQRDRQAHGWTLKELSERTNTHIGTLSQVENGIRPMTAKLARACDQCFPEKGGWYADYYEESKTWMPAGFRNWPEYENPAKTLRVWCPGIIHGYVQTPDYARCILETLPDANPAVVEARLASRMKRQDHVLYRTDAPKLHLLVDELSLYRRVGSPEIMVTQLRHLAVIARLPNVIMQILPATEHPATASELILADTGACYIEHLAGGLVFSDEVMLGNMDRLFRTIASEANRASTSLAMIERMEQTWTGVRAATAAARRGTASK